MVPFLYPGQTLHPLVQETGLPFWGNSGHIFLFVMFSKEVEMWVLCEIF